MTEIIDVSSAYITADSYQYGMPPKQPAQTKCTFRLVLAIIGAAFGSFQFGYNTGVINAPEYVIKEFMNTTSLSRNGQEMSFDVQTNLFAVVVATFAIGGAVGGLMSGVWADYFGRKNGSIINAFVGILAAALMYFSRTAQSYEMLIVGRLIVGINCGLYTCLSPIYLSEIATVQIRGALGVLHQLFVVNGLLLSQILGFPEIFGNINYWEILLGLAAAPCILQIIIMPFCPESPRHLLITKGREEDAKRALLVLRGTDDVIDEIMELKQEAQKSQSATKISILRLFRKRSLRMPLLISIVMHLSQQLSGINVIFYYSGNLFKGAGLTPEVASHATSGVGAIMVIMTVISIPLMDRVGRRRLHLIGLAGMMVSSVLITICQTLLDKVEWFKVSSIAMALLFVVFFALGPGSIPWLIVAELFSQGSRSAAISVSILVNWVANFCVGYGFPHLKDAIGNYSFVPFSVLLVGFWIFLYKYLPETKKRTIEEISAMWQKDGNKEVNTSTNYIIKYKKYTDD